MHLSAEYWISASGKPDEVLLGPVEIQSLARGAFDADPCLVDLASLPGTLKREEVVALIRSISKPDPDGLRFRDGGQVTANHFDAYRANCDLDGVPGSVDLQFGMIVGRTDMRTWPTADVVYRSPETIELDRFQENGLFPGDPVAVLHISHDGSWCFAQSYNYAAWVPTEKIAIGGREEIIAHGNAEPFLVVTGDRVVPTCNEDSSAHPDIELEMGTRLPLLPGGDDAHVKTGRAVKLPTRNEAGTLRFYEGRLHPDDDVHVGYLPFTRRNIIQQVFKFLGEPYGWGHSFNARDCTGLVLEVHKTFGLVLPRNSGQQGHSPIGKNHCFSPGAGSEEKLRVLEGADVGDLLYSPGHVMLYLGRLDGEHYVIHDVSRSGMVDENGRRHGEVFRGVSVTPLIGVHSSTGENYFEELYAIKRFR